MRRRILPAVTLCILTLAVGCQAKEPTPTSSNGLMLALAVLEKGPQGPIPQPAQLGILVQQGDRWEYTTIDDPDSNVFHKAMVYQPRQGRPAILTAGGSRAILKLWRPGAEPESLWEKDFGGKFSRMRDVESADLDGNGSTDIVVATHDQGVVAIVSPTADGWAVQELDSEPNTFVHEIELGDLDDDGRLEVYATPSLPNKLDGTPQPGSVVRYTPFSESQGPDVVAELGDRHAKEVLVEDVDGDGVDELYVSVEAVAGGRVEILRFDAGTAPDAGTRIATLDDKLCRFLTAGDVDGDGVMEMVAAAHKSGLWLLRPGDDPHAAWTISSIDRQSSGFEHAAILTDLDGDGVDELYVANDRDSEVNRYVWKNGQSQKELLHTHPEGLSGFTWNIMPVPIELIP